MKKGNVKEVTGYYPNALDVSFFSLLLFILLAAVVSAFARCATYMFVLEQTHCFSDSGLAYEMRVLRIFKKARHILEHPTILGVTDALLVEIYQAGEVMDMAPRLEHFRVSQARFVMTSKPDQLRNPRKYSRR